MRRAAAVAAATGQGQRLHRPHGAAPQGLGCGAGSPCKACAACPCSKAGHSCTDAAVRDRQWCRATWCLSRTAARRCRSPASRVCATAAQALGSACQSMPAPCKAQQGGTGKWLLPTRPPVSMPAAVVHGHVCRPCRTPSCFGVLLSALQRPTAADCCPSCQPLQCWRPGAHRRPPADDASCRAYPSAEPWHVMHAGSRQSAGGLRSPPSTPTPAARTGSTWQLARCAPACCQCCQGCTAAISVAAGSRAWQQCGFERTQGCSALAARASTGGADRLYVAAGQVCTCLPLLLSGVCSSRVRPAAASHSQHQAGPSTCTRGCQALASPSQRAITEAVQGATAWHARTWQRLIARRTAAPQSPPEP